MDSKLPLVSVVVPTYNMAGMLADSIRSVLDGEYHNVEVIVVDDGSTDNTHEIVDQFICNSSPWYDERVSYTTKINGGKASALNVALSRARGSMIAVLDADDQLTVSSLMLRVMALKDAPRAEVAIGGFEVFENDEVLGVRRLDGACNSAHLLKQFWLSYKTPFHMNACLFRRNLLEKVGSFDERLSRCQDIDFSMRLLIHAEKIVCIDEIVYRYRKHRSHRRSRLRHRLTTMHRRPIVFWKNCRPSERMLAVLGGIVVDMGKATYELVGNYYQ